MIRAFLPSMLKRNSGHIVAISSALTGTANLSAYTASKWGVNGINSTRDILITPNTKNERIVCATFPKSLI